MMMPPPKAQLLVELDALVPGQGDLRVAAADYLSLCLRQLLATD